ncbi:DUF1853 family protein [Chitinimonas sp.]|uniref:DUF1853 family protein n=1 Tax=Chitinimonas sp. TaxID=1934313 RepID=UPI0035B19798
MQRLADLHWLLCSPSLISSAPLPSNARLGDATLGEHWWRSLPQAALDAQLAQWSPQQPFRLGRYAEQLMHTALTSLPQHRLLASQLPVRVNGISHGEFDFLLQADRGHCLHIELAVKIYLVLDTSTGVHCVGPGLRDAFDLKLDRLCHHQLGLAASAAGRACLPGGIHGDIEAMAWLRGWLFYRDPQQPAAAHPALADSHLRGWWRRWGEELPQTRSDSRWRMLGKQDWLASHAAAHDSGNLAALQAALAHYFAHSEVAVMVAEYAPPEAGGAELARGMLVAAHWPPAGMLGQLQQKIAALPR